MSLSISKALATDTRDSSGNLLAATYWTLISLQANKITQTFQCLYGGYASSAAFAAEPTQPPLMTQVVNFPDNTDAPGAAWLFVPASLAALYPGNPLAFLAAMEAYVLQMPFFSGATQVP